MIQKTSEERRIHQASIEEIREEWKNQSIMLTEEWLNDMKKKRSFMTPTSAAVTTTPRVVKKICSILDLQSLKDGDIVVEAGPGPGPFVQAVLREVRVKIDYIAIELNEKFANHLKKTVDDSRLIVINESAENIEKIVRKYGSQARRIISSMPFSNNRTLSLDILSQVREILSTDGKFLLANFVPKSARLVEEAFGKENCKKDFFMNSPPTPPFILTVLASKAGQRKAS